MENESRKFVYTAEQIARLERSLSPERLAPYVTLAGNNRVAAIRLYERNTALSESLYGLLQGLEVAVRNAMHETLKTALGRADWYDHVPLYHLQSTLNHAKQKLTENGKAHDPGRMVAELSFGFWTSLTGPKFAAGLWNPYLHRAFAHKKLRRKEAHPRLDRIRKLRNRVAHHEPILNRNLQRDFVDILDTIDWICPDTRLWVEETSSFLERFNR